MVSNVHPEGVVNARTQPGPTAPGEPMTDTATIGRLTSAVRAASTETGDNTDAFLAALTVLAGQHICGTEHAGIALVDGVGQLRSQSATDICPLILDGIQQRCRCGPSLDVDEDQPTCRVDDFSAETRWPTFVKGVLACSSIRSMLAFQLFSRHRITAVLNVYATAPEAFPVDVAGLRKVLVAETLLCIQPETDSSQLLSPAIGADPVEHACRMLMHRYGIDKIAAYSLLVRLANGSHHTVAAAACRLIHPKYSVDPDADAGADRFDRQAPRPPRQEPR
jgi:hypothetical protein